MSTMEMETIGLDKPANGPEFSVFIPYDFRYGTCMPCIDRPEDGGVYVPGMLAEACFKEILLGKVTAAVKIHLTDMVNGGDQAAKMIMETLGDGENWEKLGNYCRDIAMRILDNWRNDLSFNDNVALQCDEAVGTGCRVKAETQGIPLAEAAEGGMEPGPNSYNIGFVDKDGYRDETQLDAGSLEELQEVWEMFRAEENLPSDLVLYVECNGPTETDDENSDI